MVSVLEWRQLDGNGNEHRLTHNHLPPTTVVGLLHYRRVEIIKVQFPLESDLVICVEEVESERGPGSLKGGWVPSHSQ